MKTNLEQKSSHQTDYQINKTPEWRSGSNAAKDISLFSSNILKKSGTPGLKTKKLASHTETKNAVGKTKPGTIIRVSKEGRILEIVSRGINTGIILPVEKLPGKCISEVFPPYAAAVHLKSVFKVFLSEKYIQYEYDVKKNNSLFYYQARIMRCSEDEAILMISDISDLKNAFVSSVIEGQELERERVARELHDGLGQILSALKMQIKFAMKKAGDQGDMMEKSLEMVMDAITEYKSISQNLLPPILEDTNLPGILEILCNRFNYGKKNIIVFRKEGVNSVTDKSIIRQLYRISQELITNAIKHAECSSIIVELRQEKTSVSIIVTDNGKGFDIAKFQKNSTGMGLKNLFARTELLGGSLKFYSSKDEGTRAILTVPVIPGSKTYLQQSIVNWQ